MARMLTNHGAQGHIPLSEVFTEARVRALVLDEVHHLRARVMENIDCG
jgi:superfamily II DNA or RNA helicase